MHRESVVTILLLEYKGWLGYHSFTLIYCEDCILTCKRNMASHTNTLFGIQNMSVILKW